MKHLHHMPQFLLIILIHTVGPRDCCMGHDKSLLQSKKLIIIISLKLYIVC